MSLRARMLLLLLFATLVPAPGKGSTFSVWLPLSGVAPGEEART